MKDVNEIVKTLDEIENITKKALETVYRLRADILAAPIVPPKSLDEVKAKIPEDLQKKLDFKQEANNVIVKPVSFLGSDNFAKIAQIIKNGMGGEYISAGKDSHFTVKLGGAQ